MNTSISTVWLSIVIHQEDVDLKVLPKFNVTSSVSKNHPTTATEKEWTVFKSNDWFLYEMQHWTEMG